MEKGWDVDIVITLYSEMSLRSNTFPTPSPCRHAYGSE